MKSYNNSSNHAVPDNELFNRIRNSKASIEEALAYYESLQTYLSKDPIGDPRYSIAMDHLIYVEMILENIEGALPPKSPPGRAAEFEVIPTPQKRESLERTLREKTITELEAEIIAAATSNNSKLALTKVAALNNLPLNAIEAIATTLLKDQKLDARYDLSKTEYERCMQEIRDLELKEDPGEKDWKLWDLGRKYNRPKKEMLENYYKSLIVQHLESPVSFEDFTAQHREGRKWVLRGWIPEQSIVLLHGHGGHGKTLFTHHLMKHITTGVDWDEYKVRNGNNGILYIQSDTPLISAVESLKQTGLPNDVPIQLHGRWGVQYMHYLYRWVKEHRPALTVIDSITSVNRHSTIHENDTLYAQPILQLHDIAAEFGTAFILIHHSNSAGEARGTKAIRAAVDEIWKLERASKDESDPKRILTIEKSRSRANGRYDLQFDDDDFAWSLLEPVDTEGNPTQNKSARWLIVDYINKRPNINHCIESLAQEVQISEATLRKELPGLCREGLIDRVLNPNYVRGRSYGDPKHFYLIRMW